MVFLSGFIFCIMVGSTVSAAGVAPCTADTSIMVDACSENDDASMFLQISKSAKPGRQVETKQETESNLQELSPSIRTSAINPIDCKVFKLPIQVLKDGKGFAFKELNVDTGVYKTLFDIPFNTVFPPYVDLNSCGINPVDGIPYCTMWSKNAVNYLVRVGSKKIEYVAKLPKPPRRFYNSGAFSPDGTFYVSDESANFLILKDVDKVPGVTKAFNPKMTDYSKGKLVRAKGFRSAADMVVVKKNLGMGEAEYVIILNKGYLMIAKSDGGKFTSTSVRRYIMGGKKGSGQDKFGAGWSFSGKVFFAHNKGKGVYQIDLTKLNLKQRASNFALKKIGKSAPSGFNDGANCMNAADPWKTGVLPIDCKAHGTPLQSVRVPGRGYVIHKPSFDAGSYEVAFQLPFSKTTPPYKYLNAIGINPEDSVAYGCMLFTEPHKSFYIVRFDGTGFEFVMKIADAHDPIAGTFNSKGDFFFLHNTKGGYNPVLFSVSGLADLKGYKSPKDRKLPVLRNLKGLILWRYHQFGDIVSVKYDLEGSGVTDEYIVAINHDGKGVFIDWDEKNATKSKVTGLTFPNPWGSAKQTLAYGAAWNYKGQVYFSADEGWGTLQLEKVDFAKGTMKLKKLGKSHAVLNTDGFNCWD